MSLKLQLKEATRLPDQPPRGHNTISARTLPGDVITNLRGEDLGRIRELAIDPDSGLTIYAIATFEGVLAGSRRQFAVPWSELSVAYHDRRFILNASCEQLRRTLFRALVLAPGPLSVTGISLANLLRKPPQRAAAAREAGSTRQSG